MSPPQASCQVWHTMCMVHNNVQTLLALLAVSGLALLCNIPIYAVLLLYTGALCPCTAAVNVVISAWPPGRPPDAPGHQTRQHLLQ